MKVWGQLTVGILTALGSSLMVVAAILLSLAEGSTLVSPPTTTPAARTAGVPVLPNPQASSTPTRPSVMMVITPTEVPQVQCPIPPGWSAYTLSAGDTLEALAARSAVTVEQIQQANCLISSSLLPGTILYLPPTTPSPTLAFQPSSTPRPTATPCLPPPGWIRYQIQPNETLTRISLAFGVRVDQLMAANCLNSAFIVAGAYLYVPNVPTRTPELPATLTPTHTQVVEPTATFTQVPPTPEPATPTPSEETPTDTPTATSTEPPTATSTDTLTPAPTETFTPTASSPAPAEDLLTPTPTASVTSS